MTTNKTLDVGVLEPLLSDPNISEIMVNGYDSVYVERRGVMERIEDLFQDEEQVYNLIRTISEWMGRHIDEANPILDLRFEDTSRMHIVIPPIAANGPSFVIRKFMKRKLSFEQLVEWHALSEAMATFLKAAIQSRLNIVICGETGSGKTSVLQLFLDLVPHEERIIVVEMASELQLDQPNQVQLEYRPPNIDGKGEITLANLVMSALHMRPDRVILAEILGEEVLPLIQALNRGHDGSITTIHANSPHDVLARMEAMATMGNPSIPLLTIRQQMASALNLIVHIERGFDGQRRILKIAEVGGMQGGDIQLRDLFEFVQSDYTNNHISGYFTATGLKPTSLRRFEGTDIRLDESLFMPHEV